MGGQTGQTKTGLGALRCVCITVVAAAALLRYFYIVFKDKKVWKVCKERK